MSSTVHAPTTTELLRAAAAGDQAAWSGLIRRFEPTVTATVRAHRLQPADRQDAAQRTWTQLVERHQEIREPEALGAWLRTTARRECLQAIGERRRFVTLDDPEGTELRDPAVDVEQCVVDAETVRRLRGLLDRLPARAAALITALFGEEPRHYAEIAHSTGIPIGSIGPTRARSLDQLRRLFDGEPTTSVQAPAGRVHCSA
jgi:RNA polymerase sigma factor (sigma-70 family)